MSILLGKLADTLKAELHGDESCRIDRVATLQSAGPGSISFLANHRYRGYLTETRASAVILSPADLPECPVFSLVLGNPYLAYAKVASLLNPISTPPCGIHPAAWVSAKAKVHKTAWVGAQAVVDDDVSIGAKSYIGAGCVVNSQVTVGNYSRLVANVTLCRDVVVGERTFIHPGVVIGGDGFGIANDNGTWVRVPQLGTVRVGDNVEIGANTTIDRGALEDTIIEDGVKIDNQVQIGHNVRIGAHTAIAGCVAIAGSVRIGKRCVIGGATSIAGHLNIADDVYLTGASQVAKSISKPGIYSSWIPVQESLVWRKNVARLHQLDDIARRIKALENTREVLSGGKL
uniref:UDP-3-O-acylglucosamine N-acyltransferase n=1 Tax=Candidatus Kentrum sp. LFY TaxID=2126342 RepID=A0A450W8N6_9GAMM|nr:MAG: UDP-3-O-[3-hydroxymyristoyl] glucosamine N-acyltransferase [Candidatus Kentron sp. LFY]VFJ96247.1 MAG: UDP-3-O-[3-hydroxymyristoyl] glucosamine N-acyltransferase [Candidatus Kentron sp. LFY]VFK13358.1 MAG: UDP-3-O-[3-hydroxymyristoyl] glucosamine N-acyltransferase [Candidatus Kentron sp. LFY]